MSSSFNIARTVLVLGIAGFAAGVAAPDASAFGGFGGAHMSGFGGRGGGFGRVQTFNAGRTTVGQRGPGGFGRRVPPNTRIPPITIGQRTPVDNPCTLRRVGSNCGRPQLPPPPRLTCRFHPNLPFCHGWPPVIVRNPPVIVPSAVIGRAPVTLAAAPAAYSAIAPAASLVCNGPGAPISIVFQPTATASDITAFLGSYNAKVGNGPDKDGVYRLRLEDGSLTPDQYAQVIQSMRSQTAIVSSING